jgi:hypothetical protein
MPALPVSVVGFQTRPHPVPLPEEEGTTFLLARDISEVPLTSKIRRKGDLGGSDQRPRANSAGKMPALPMSVAASLRADGRPRPGSEAIPFWWQLRGIASSPARPRNDVVVSLSQRERTSLLLAKDIFKVPLTSNIRGKGDLGGSDQRPRTNSAGKMPALPMSVAASLRAGRRPRPGSEAIPFWWRLRGIASSPARPRNDVVVSLSQRER